MSLASRENIIATLASLRVSREGTNAIYCEACRSHDLKIGIDSRESRYEISCLRDL
jgi:hypothetical protein